MIWRLVFVFYVLTSGLAMLGLVVQLFAGISTNGHVPLYFDVTLVADLPWTPLIFVTLELLDASEEAYLYVSIICIAFNAFLLWGVCYSSRAELFERAVMLLLAAIASENVLLLGALLLRWAR